MYALLLHLTSYNGRLAPVHQSREGTRAITARILYEYIPARLGSRHTRVYPLSPYPGCLRSLPLAARNRVEPLLASSRLCPTGIRLEGLVHVRLRARPPGVASPRTGSRHGVALVFQRSPDSSCMSRQLLVERSPSKGSRCPKGTPVGAWRSDPTGRIQCPVAPSLGSEG